MTLSISATYSPEDNKLRLYASSRLDSETYNRVKAAGFKWAPKQELFVAPMWTPSREDFCLDLAGEIEDEDTSLVERAEAKADRLEDLSARRAQDASQAHAAVHAIADGIPFGQPILVGHHSEKHARKDAQKIENGMRKAVDCWKAAEYWQERATAAKLHAEYKERPDVRARLIKGLEADRRKCERNQADAKKTIDIWENLHDDEKAIARRKKDGSATTFQERARFIAGHTNTTSYDIYSGLDKGTMTPEEAQRQTLENARRVAAINLRWIEHYNNRIAYERAMLDDQGGLVAEQQEIKVGGRVLVGGEWFTVLRVNSKNGRVCSFRTQRRYCPIIGAEEVRGYEPPSEDQAAQAQAAMKKGPLCNYPAEGFATCTEAEWKAIYSDYKTSRTIPATETTGAHRVRYVIGFRVHLPAPTGKELEPGFCSANRTHSYWPVYVTDAKRKDPPTKTPEAPASVDDLTPAMFNHSDDTGKIRAGIKYTTRADGPGGECYQFDTLEELQSCARAYQEQPGMIEFSIVTHSGQYKNMRTVYTWKQPEQEQEPKAEATEETPAQDITPAQAQKLPFNQDVQFTRATDEEIAAALSPQTFAQKIKEFEQTLKSGVQIVSAPQLFPTPPALAERMVNEAGIEEGQRILEPSAGTGQILGLALHNRPAVEAIAVEINSRLIEFLEVQHTAGAYPGASFICGDFLEQNGNLGTFDRILMNPPFERGADITHIKHAMHMLRPGGRLVAICANGPRQQATLKPMAEASGGWYEELPAGTFADQGTNVNTALLLIEN
jgi:protein-L-isoaspartate O-methyltransferase